MPNRSVRVTCEKTIETYKIMITNIIAYICSTSEIILTLYYINFKPNEKTFFYRIAYCIFLHQ